jgi:acyl dehydratase
MVLRQISAIETQRFAVSIDDMNPLYFDDDFARSQGFKGIIAPPTYLAAVLGWEAGPPQSELLSDGNNPDAVPQVLKGKKMMGGGQKLTFHAPVYPGDTLSCCRELVDLRTKQTRSGVATFAVSQVHFFNQDGSLVLSCEETLIARD